jgi:hypothetical protein
MSNAMDYDISCAACAAPVFLPHQPEARSGTWRLRQQQPLTQEWLRKCRRRSSSRSSACRQARDEQRWAAFASRLVVVAAVVVAAACWCGGSLRVRLYNYMYTRDRNLM